MGWNMRAPPPSLALSSQREVGPQSASAWRGQAEESLWGHGAAQVIPGLHFLAGHPLSEPQDGVCGGRGTQGPGPPGPTVWCSVHAQPALRWGGGGALFGWGPCAHVLCSRISSCNARIFMSQN